MLRSHVLLRSIAARAHLRGTSRRGATSSSCWISLATAAARAARPRFLAMAAAGATAEGLAAAESAAAPASAGACGLCSLEALRFVDTFTKELPGDPSEERRPRQVQGAFYSFVTPTPTGSEPELVAASADVARLVGLDPAECDRPEFAMVFSGNAPMPGARPYAQCYGGHQFGAWAGQLGDGRAICLGEVVNASTRERWELQLKGAGRTPYSRSADGRAVLRSSLREFVASEAMAALGVPTTRALSLVSTGDAVVRDMFYSGNPQLEPGAVVCRVARSFIRFGTFQLPVSRGEEQAPLVRTLADYVIRHHYPECALPEGGGGGGSGADAAAPNGAAACDAGGRGSGGGSNQYSSFLTAVAQRTGALVAEWSRVGFVHGVLNTDNMSVLGETIDYGPYAWMERFDPYFTPNTTDLPGRRYAFRAQPEIGQFNVVQLARALLASGLVSEDEAADGVAAYGRALTAAHNANMARKLGLKRYDQDLAVELQKAMYADQADFTNTYRALGAVGSADPGGDERELPPALAASLGPLSEERAAAWASWLRSYRAALRAQGWGDDAERRAVQDAANPALVPRNHVLVGIINEAEGGDYEPLRRLLAALARPYDAVGLDPAWTEPAPASPRLGVELLSCSS